MNTDTGQIYRGHDQIQQAVDRGEPIVEVTSRSANLSQAQRKRLGKCMAKLKAARPNLPDEEVERIAINMARR